MPITVLHCMKKRLAKAQKRKHVWNRAPHAFLRRDAVAPAAAAAVVASESSVAEENSDVVLYAAAECPRTPTSGGNPYAARLPRPFLWHDDKGKSTDGSTDARARRRVEIPVTGAGGASGEAEPTAGTSSDDPGSTFTFGSGMQVVQAS